MTRMRHLVRIADLSPGEVDRILELAAEAMTAPPVRRHFFVTLMFLSSSTRTRLGFAAATSRLGGSSAVVTETRFIGRALPRESLPDTLRVISGMSNVVVLRVPDGETCDPLTHVARCSVVNGGDRTAHPTQALIDRFAIEQLVGPLNEVRVGISGDMTKRAASSLLELLAMSPPSSLVLFAPPGRGEHGVPLGSKLAARTTMPPDSDFSDLDVLLLPGLAPGQDQTFLNQETRDRWAFTKHTARSLPKHAVVLSPGPVIDEIHHACRNDRRIRVFEQSDLGVHVRTGVLRWLLEHGDDDE